MNININSLEYNKYLLKKNNPIGEIENSKEYNPREINIPTISKNNSSIGEIENSKEYNSKGVVAPSSKPQNSKTAKTINNTSVKLAKVDKKLDMLALNHKKDADTLLNDDEFDQLPKEAFFNKKTDINSISKKDLDKITGVVDGIAFTRNNIKVSFGTKTRKIVDKIPWELNLYEKEDPFWGAISGATNFLAGGVINSWQDSAKVIMIMLSNVLAYVVKGNLPAGDDAQSQYKVLTPEQINQFGSVSLVKDPMAKLGNEIMRLVDPNLPNYGSYIGAFVKPPDPSNASLDSGLSKFVGWRKDFRRYHKIGHLSDLVDPNRNIHYPSYKFDTDTFKALKDKYKNELGFLHVSLLTKDGAKKIKVPFQNNVLLEEGEILAQYDAMNFLGRIGEIYSYTNTKLSAVTLTTKYIVLSDKNKRNGGSSYLTLPYLSIWHYEYIEQIVEIYKSLVYPYWNEGEYYRPPLVRVCNDKKSAYSSNVGKPFTNKLKDFIVTSVSVKNNVDENEIYINGKGEKNGICYEVTLNLAEVSADYLAKQDSMAEFYPIIEKNGFIANGV